MDAITLHYKPFRFNDDEFYDFCQQNTDLKLERLANGTIIVMPNTGGKTGIQNGELNFQAQVWNKQHKLGKVFDSSTAFRLPSGAVRSADVSFVGLDRWNALTDAEQEKFPPLCPDFVIELMSKSDTLRDAKAKMLDDWMENGCRLGWLIDPKTETIYIYRANGSIQINEGFGQRLLGEDVLPGFELDLTELFAK
jgi:Uma2 family endonuclease